MRPAFAACLLAIAATPAAAQEDLDCENAMAQVELNMCADQDYRKADAELNKIWKEARQTAKELDADQSSDDMKGAEAALLAAQRAWITYRDRSCELAGFEARGGSMEPMLVSGCLAEMTRARTKELRSFMGEENQ
ncbi:MAG: lysozyme inhibitor LprI family protein [Rhizobiaceae bacterium]|nr:lysozyme inhibitor LprI family protein [Rhizobiaceae bacterium]